MGFLDFLTTGLKKTRSNLVVQVDGISGKLAPGSCAGSCGK